MPRYTIRHTRQVIREATFDAPIIDDAISQAREVDENESDWEGWDTTDQDCGHFAVVAVDGIRTPKTMEGVIAALTTMRHSDSGEAHAIEDFVTELLKWDSETTPDMIAAIADQFVSWATALKTKAIG